MIVWCTAAGSIDGWEVNVTGSPSRVTVCCSRGWSLSRTRTSRTELDDYFDVRSRLRKSVGIYNDVIGAGQQIFDAEFPAIIGSGLSLEGRISGMDDYLRRRNSGTGGSSMVPRSVPRGFCADDCEGEKEQR